MSLLQTEMEGKPICLCTKSSMTFVAPLRMGAKCTTEHIQQSSTRASAIPQRVIDAFSRLNHSTRHISFHASYVRRQEAGTFKLKTQCKMEENDAHHLNRTPLNHHLLPEIAPVVIYG